MGAPHVHVEQVTTHSGTGPPEELFSKTTKGCGNVFIYIDVLLCVVLLKSSSGGGPVSGGGTLYMKWGAGSLRYRECEMRERVVKHTLTLIFSHTHNKFSLSTYVYKINLFLFSQKNHQKKC